MKNKTWGAGRKIHCQGENRVIAWAAKDLMQHRISSTLFLIWRQLTFRSLLTLPCGFLFEQWLLDQVVRGFPQPTLHGSPKISQVPQRAGVTCVWHLRKVLELRLGSRLRTIKMSLSMWAGLHLPTREARAWLCSQMLWHLTGWSLQSWMTSDKGFGSLAGAGSDILFIPSPHQLHRKGTQDPYGSPGLCSSNRTPGTSLAWTISVCWQLSHSHGHPHCLQQEWRCLICKYLYTDI